MVTPRDTNPTPSPTRPGSEWGSQGNQSGSNATTGSVNQGDTGFGNIVVAGFGNPTTKIVNPGTSFASVEATVGDARYSDASDIKALFVQLDRANDPRLTQWMASIGTNNIKVAQKIWNDAADYTYKLSKAGKDVSFFDEIQTEKFQKNYLDLSKLSGGNNTGSTKYISITDKVDADALLKKTMSDMLDRQPTKAEYADFLKQLNKNENKYFKTTTYSNGVQKTTGAEFDKTSFVNQYVLNKVSFSKDLEGTAGYVQDVVKQSIYNNGLSGYVSDAVARKWMVGLASGNLTKEQLNSNIRNQAIQVYKPYAKIMQDNPTLSLAEAASSYLTAYQRTLEIDAPQIDIKDALSKAIKTDNTGETVMSLFDYEKTLKSDPRYQYTKAAANTAQNLAYSFARAFGVNL